MGMPIPPIASARPYVAPPTDLDSSPVEKKPHDAVDSFGCFGISSKPALPTYSLVALHDMRNSLKEKSASELASLWQNFKQINPESPGLYARFVAWKNDTPLNFFWGDTRLALLNEIAERFISGHSIRDPSTELSQVLEEQIVLHVIKTIQDRAHKAQCYHNVTLSGIKKFPQFDQIFMKELCTGNYSVSDIEKFFSEAREFKIPHKHLFLNLDLHKFSEPVIETLKKEAQKSQATLMSSQEIAQRKVWITEYNQILEACKVPESNWALLGVPQKDADHGYRLAARALHPDRNPQGEKTFKRLTELAEKLGTKNA